MSFADDNEILQDFLVEAGELLEKLSGQLVELEQRPDDPELLNAIFRGFHTVKGGAGFLQINPMVECCHKTESLFDLLRKKERTIDATMMDVVLQALDSVNNMFSALQEGHEPDPAPASLLARLEELVTSRPQLASPPVTTALTNVPITPAQQATGTGKPDEINDADFQAFVESLQDIPDSHELVPAATAAAVASTPLPAAVELFDDAPATTAVTPKETAAPVKSSSASLSSEEITDDEFEALLDSLHGKGKTAAGKPAAAKENLQPEVPARDAPPVVAAPAAPVAKAVPAGNKDEISDDEFEALLDQLHGKLAGSSSKQAAPSVTAAKPASPQAPAAVAQPATPAPAATPISTPAPAAPVTPVSRASAVNEARKDTLAVKGKEKPGEEEANAEHKLSGATAENTVRVDTQRLDDIMNMVGELVLVRNRLVRLASNSSDESIGKAISNLDVVTADLQTSVMKTRMQPIKKVFGRFPRVVRDLARNLRKEVTLELVGEETDLDKNLVEALADPLVHLVRNAVDHGIETPQVRESKGKSRHGTVILAAEQEGDHILLTISDDGAGMDPNILRRKAAEKGLMDEDAAGRLSDREAYDLIFMPGFSTKTEISDVSGRGVGMDVVKTKITQLNGTVEIDSRVGEGSRIMIKVPLTLAIMPTLMVMLESQIFAFPLVSVNEIFNLDVRSTNVVDGQEVVLVRDKPVPLFHLKRWLINRADHTVSEHSHVVIVNVGAQKVGFVVDQLIGQEEVVIKPLGKMLVGTPGIAGATITGDGTIALILDIPGLINNYAASRHHVDRLALRRQPEIPEEPEEAHAA